LVSPRSQMEAPNTAPEIATVLRSVQRRIVHDAAQCGSDECLVTVPDVLAESRHRPFENVVNVRLGVFADVEFVAHALFAAARSVARWPRSRRYSLMSATGTRMLLPASRLAVPFSTAA